MPAKVDPRDIVNKKFTRLTVLRVDKKDKNGHYEYFCICDCGKKIIVLRNELLTNKKKSCGCLSDILKEERKLAKMQETDKKYIGKTYGRLTILSRHMEYILDNRYPYLCQCSCGEKVIVPHKNMVTGNTLSCGCLKSDVAGTNTKNKRIEDDKKIIGIKINHLTILRRHNIYDKQGRLPFVCLCDCGQECIISKNHLFKENGTKSCGCVASKNVLQYKDNIRKNFNWQHYIGKTFGRLTPFKYEGYQKYDDARFTCSCSCGNTREHVKASWLDTNKTPSCGCVKTEIYGVAPNKVVKIVNRRERMKFVNSSERKQVLKRDNYKCILCGKDHKGMHVHHINQWKFNTDARYTTNNLVTLCFDCHMFKAHIKVGIINPDYVPVFQKYIESLTHNDIILQKKIG